MTNEDAITNLNMIRVAFVNVTTQEQIKLVNDTFDVSIQALKSLDNLRNKYQIWRKICEELVAEIEDLTAENEDLRDQLAMRDRC